MKVPLDPAQDTQSDVTVKQQGLTIIAHGQRVDGKWQLVPCSDERVVIDNPEARFKKYFYEQVLPPAPDSDTQSINQSINQ